MDGRTRLWVGLLSLATCGSVSSVAHAEWPFSAEYGARRGTREYYEQRSGDPVGQRQRTHFGVSWPGVPRPCGPEMTCAHKYYHASIWPYPYICDDRADVQRVCQGQIANGWAAETTFYDYHFDQFSHELNSAGREKVAWIVSSAPPQFRQAYLAPSRLDQSVDDRRMASMQKESARISDGALQVSARVALPDGRPAHEVQSIFEFRRENPIPPKITYAGVGSAGK